MASKFNIFESHGQKDFLFTYDDHEADIALDVSALPDKDLIFEKIHFKQKSVSAEVLISKKLINNTPLDVVEVAKNSLNPRFLRKIQAQAFGQGNVDGLGDEQFQDIFQYNSYVNKIEDIDTFTDFGAMYNDFVSKAENLNGAVLVVDNTSVARSLKDVSGNAVFKGQISADGTIGTVEGIPVRVQNMNGKGLAVLMREDAYAVSVSQKSFELDTIVDDTELAKKSAISVYGSVMASGMVVNPSAIKILAAGASMSTQAKTRKAKGE